MNIESSITRFKVFSLRDTILNQITSTKENVAIFGYWRSATTFLAEQIEVINALGEDDKHWIFTS